MPIQAIGSPLHIADCRPSLRGAYTCVAGAAGSDSPHSVRMEVRVRMESGAVVLDGEQGGAPVLRAGTRGTTTVARVYAKTVSVRTAVAGMGVVTPEGTVVRTGALLPPSSSIVRKSEGEGPPTNPPPNILSSS